MLLQVFSFLVLTSTAFCWDYDAVDFEIFDLFEEVNGTFYELLEINPTASVSEIRRAYRKKSLVLHPDKNTEVDAEVKFRQLVAVYEVLKDSTKREKYDKVLQDGLPTWRQPAYYYRKYRKMGTLEISIIVSVIATIGHYLTWYVAYWEKKLEINEKLDPIRKRQEKKKLKGKLNDEENLDTDYLLEKELGYRKPTAWDILPFVLFRLVVAFIKNTPSQIREFINKKKEEKKRKLEEEKEKEEAAKAWEAEKLKPKKVKEKPVLRDASEFENEQDAYTFNNDVDSGDKNAKIVQTRKGEEWTDEDVATLAKAMAKYPGGTPGRWDRIGHDLGRSANEVTKKVKEMKSSISSNMTLSASSEMPVLKKKNIVNLSDSIITKTIDSELKKTTFISDSDLYQSQYDIPDDYDEGCTAEEDKQEPIEIYAQVKIKVKTRPVEEVSDDKNETEENVNNEKEPETWSQVQQKCLEAAIAQFPKSTADRWTCIARAVPNKTKEQCIARFKVLAEHVKQRNSKGS